MKLNKPIMGSRLSLQTLITKAAEGNYQYWVNDRLVNQFLELRHCIPNVDDLKMFIENMNESSHHLLLGIFLGEHKHIGNIKLGPIDWQNKRGSVGLMIGDRMQWGKGYATEAIKVITHYAFNKLELNSLHAGCYAENIGSYKAFLKGGYKEEGRQTQYWKLNDGFTDNILLGKLHD